MNWKPSSGANLDSALGVAVGSCKKLVGRLGTKVGVVLAFGLATGLHTAAAQSSDNPRFSIGIGADHALGGSVDDRPGRPLPYVSMEVASARLTEPADLRLGSAADLSPYGIWAGVGPVLGVGLFGTSFYVEASLMPGLWLDFEHQYRVGAFENGLGHPLEFRSQLGFGWEMDAVSSVLVTLSHKSNANISGATANPGMEAIQLRYSQSF